jgi:hypothetical protein
MPDGGSVPIILGEEPILVAKPQAGVLPDMWYISDN